MSYKEDNNKKIRIKHRIAVLWACRISIRRVLLFQNEYMSKMYVKMQDTEFKKLIQEFNKKGGKYSPKSSIEIEPLGNLLKNIGAVEMYKVFVTELYPKATVENVTAIGKDILSIKNRRNDAAHSKILDYSTVQEDKYIVFHNNDSLSFAIEIHDLFNRILDIVE